jgi:hypothetical protein
MVFILLVKAVGTAIEFLFLDSIQIQIAVLAGV